MRRDYAPCSGSRYDKPGVRTLCLPWESQTGYRPACLHLPDTNAAPCPAPLQMLDFLRWCARSSAVIHMRSSSVPLAMVPNFFCPLSAFFLLLWRESFLKDCGLLYAYFRIRKVCHPTSFAFFLLLACFLFFAFGDSTLDHGRKRLARAVLGQEAGG